jgi:hypothetical protein
MKLSVRLILSLTFALSLTWNFATGQERTARVNTKPKEQKLPLVWRPGDAVRATLDVATKVQDDISQKARPGDELPILRFIWLTGNPTEALRVTAFTENAALSTHEVIRSPEMLTLFKSTGVSGHLVMIDLRQLASDETSLNALIKTYERLSEIDPVFLVHRKVEARVPTKVKCQPYKAADGKTYDYKYTETNSGAPSLVSEPGQDWAIEWEQLCTLLNTRMPLIRYDVLTVMSLTTLNGGLYYEFQGFEEKPAKGTPEEAFWKKFGIDFKQIAKLRSDQRVGLTTSNVTGKPRAITIVHGFNNRNGTGLGVETYDPDDADTGADQDPIRNLVEFKFKASEVIVEKSNGFHAFAAFNNKEELQRVVPDNVACDHTIPTPYTKQLQPGISCISCHGPQGGWKGAENQVAKLLKPDSLDNVDVFSDSGALKRARPKEQVDRLAGLYSGDSEKILNRGRADYSDAIFIATKGAAAQEVMKDVMNVRNHYLYEPVDPQKACLECAGVVVERGSAAELFRVIMGKLPPDPITGISFEDPYIAMLKKDIPISRNSWNSILVDAATRAAVVLNQREKQK